MNLIKHVITNKAKAKYKDLGLSEELLSIFLKQKKYRTIQDNLYLTQNFEYFDCFQKILKNYKEGELMFETIIKNLDFLIYDPGKVIYTSYDIISNMFYIFYGSVKIDKKIMKTLSPIRRPKSPSKEKKNKKKDKKDFRKLGFVIKLINAMKKSLIKKESDLSNFDFNDNEIILSKGDEYGFDEINNNRRKYTAITKSTCIIGFLSKEDWKYIFEKTDVIKKNDMLKFLEGLQIFKNRNNDKIINNIYNSINERSINIGGTLIKFGEELKKYYIIRKGFFQVEVKMKQKINNAFNDIDSFGNYNEKEKTANIKYEAKNYYTKVDNFKIITYGKGGFLGDIEFYLGSKRYLTNISCKSNSAIVYEINSDDLIKYMTPNLRETLIKEGRTKLEYFKKRFHGIQIFQSNKINSKNKYKQIILNKLEEEKGDIFQYMENKKNGLFLYKQKQRKRLKTASLNENVKNFYPNSNFNNYKYNNYLHKRKQNKNKIENNYLSIFNNKDIKKIKFKLPASVKSNKTNIKLFKSNKNNINIDFASKMLNNIYDLLSPEMNGKIFPLKGEKTISTLFNTIKNNKDINMNNLELKRKINNNEINNIKSIDFKLTPEKDIMKLILSKKFIPKTPNEKILKAYSNLCTHQPLPKTSLKLNDNNDINYYATQNYSFLKTNDKSINESNSNTNTIYALKTVENKNIGNLKRSIPLLTEFVCIKKELCLKEFSLEKYKNYKISYYNKES